MIEVTPVILCGGSGSGFGKFQGLVSQSNFFA
jgi:hypothetical protein